MLTQTSRLSRSAPCCRNRSGEHLIPLINVVFLLLIFFMLSGHLERPDAIPVQPPESSRDTQAEPIHRILLLGRDGRVALDETILEPSELPQWFEAQGLSEPPKITLKADAQASAAQLRTVLGILRGIGVRKITLLTTRPQ